MDKVYILLNSHPYYRSRLSCNKDYYVFKYYDLKTLNILKQFYHIGQFNAFSLGGTVLYFQMQWSIKLLVQLTGDFISELQRYVITCFWHRLLYISHIKKHYGHTNYPCLVFGLNKKAESGLSRVYEHWQLQLQCGTADL